MCGRSNIDQTINYSNKYITQWRINQRLTRTRNIMPDTYRVDIDSTFLRFNPSNPKFYSQICADIPEFNNFKSEHAKAEITKVKIFSWIVVMFDMNTPLRREIKDLYKRKVYAATLCGMNPHPQTGKYKDWIENILTGQDEKVNNLIVKFIASFASPEYMQLIAHMSMQHNTLDKIVKGKADKNDVDMFDKATDKIKALTGLLYGSGERDEVYEARRALYKQVAYDLSDMRPESVAQMVIDKGGVNPEWSPYEEGYVPDDIHFVGDDPEIAKNDEE